MRCLFVRCFVLSLAAGVQPGPCELNAQIVRQLTVHVSGGERGVGGVDDSGVVYFVSAEDPEGLNPDGRYQVMSWDPTTGNVTQITQLHRGVVHMDLAPAVSDDGQWIAFVSQSDPFGTNHDQGDELFAIRSDGTQLAQLTQDPAGGSPMNFNALSGDGSTIAFTSKADYLGTNPGGISQLFVIGRDGSNLDQLTAADFEIWWVSISDDGSRITFFTKSDLKNQNPDNFDQVYTIESSGMHLRQLVTTLRDSNFPHVAGDGSMIAFNSTDDGAPEVYVANWNGSGLLQLTSSFIGGAARGWARYPTLTDDADWVYYEQQDLFRKDVVRQRTDASVVQDLLDLNGACTGVRISGNAVRFALWCVDGENFGQPNPDDGPETITAEGDGANPEVITDRLTASSTSVDITPDGSRVVFASSADFLGGDPDLSGDIYRLDVDTGDLVQVTTLDRGAPVPNIIFPYLPMRGPDLPKISGDGGTVVFAHNGDPTGGNPDLGRELYAIDADGANLRQLTASTSSDARCGYPHLSADGGTVVFRCNADLVGGGGLSGMRMFKVAPDATGLVELAAVDGFPRIDDAGNWVVFAQSWDPFGTNADGSREIFRIRGDGTGLQQLTDELVASDHPDVSADGALVTFVRGGEVFVHDATAGTDTQLTVALAEARLPVISGDGSWVYFQLATSPGGGLHRVRVADGFVQRVDGLDGQGAPTARFPFAPTYAVDEDGDRFAAAMGGNPADLNFDELAEIFLIDRSTPPAIAVSPGLAPTVVSWTVMSGPVRYDVIRGDVANLALPGGGISDLGTVVCLDDDSPDANTIGSEDPVTPAVGQVWFYVLRAIEADGSSGGYGVASSGEIRTPGSGDCGM